MKNQITENKVKIACCPRCPPYSHSVLYSTEGITDVVFCKVYGEIPVSEVNEVLLNDVQLFAPNPQTPQLAQFAL